MRVESVPWLRWGSLIAVLGSDAPHRKLAERSCLRHVMSLRAWSTRSFAGDPPRGLVLPGCPLWVYLDPNGTALVRSGERKPCVGARGEVVIEPLFDVTSAILIVAHGVLSGLLALPQGAAWTFAIISVTVGIRVVLLPVFVRQIHNRRKLQALQPRLEELKREYGHDAERFREEKLKLYATVGTKPYLSWLPLLVTLPVLFALSHTLVRATGHQPQGVGFMSDRQAGSLGSSILFGSVRLSDSVAHSGGTTSTTVAACLVAVLVVVTFLTQHHGLRVGMSASALTSDYAQQQKITLYALPAVFVLGGIAFPIGVLIYWVTESLWAMSEQLWVIRNYPLPDEPP